MAQTTTKDIETRHSDTLEPGLIKGFLGPKLRVFWNLLSARSVAALEPFGLRIGAFSTLALISANPGCSQIELARALGMDKSAVVAIIDELEAKGLAKRLRSTQDRRRHALSLSAQGETTLSQMHKHLSKVGLPIREALSPQEMEQLLSLMERAHQALVQSQ